LNVFLDMLFAFGIFVSIGAKRRIY